jgi:hypothetical protein
MTVPNIVTPKIKPIEYSNDKSYEYLLAVSSDSLYVLSPDRSRIFETIVKGEDNNGYLVSADCENDFLDAIVIIKRDILSGLDPLDWILKSL